MGIFIKTKSNVTAAAAAMIICILMIIFSDAAVMSAKNGIILWFSSVLPAMLPFFICVNFMTEIGLISLLPVNIFPFAMSALSGYPMGAKVVGDMCRSGTVDAYEARRLMSFCSTSGPVFMIGAVGVGMLGSQAAGIVIAVSHYAGAVLNGIIYSFVMKRGAEICHLQEQQTYEQSLMDHLTKSIFSAFKSMAVILAYIIFFSFLMNLVDMTGLFEFIKYDTVKCLLNGFMEMTVGCSLVMETGLSLRYSSTLAAMIISWGGLSILGQSMAMLTGTGVSLGYIVLTKVTHSIFAGIIALFIGELML